MKILMLSMFSPHFVNWAEQLKASGHEVHWLDVYDSNIKVEKINFIQQIRGWRYKYNYPGRYFLKSKAPGLTNYVNKINERNLESFFELKLLEIKPDVVHSFVMFVACYPVYKVMKKYPRIKWIYSSWGSDMYFVLNSEKFLTQAEKVLPNIDYMFTDCSRDYDIAMKCGFKGDFLGVFPGGGGFDLKKIKKYRTTLKDRKTILIKGYQGDLGRCIPILRALETLKEEFGNYNIVVFAAASEVIEFVKYCTLSNWPNLEVFSKLPNEKVLELMGRSKVYIGNSISDGIPNTLLEAIVCGAFPIQSNPGGASAEIIQDGFNGILINNAEDISEIRKHLKRIASEKVDILKGVEYNSKEITPNLDRELVKIQVLNKYQLVESQL